MIDRQRFKDWEFYLVEVEARWKKVKETTLFWPDASTAILMDYDIPDLFKRLRELEAENVRLKAVVEAAWKILRNCSCDECGEDLDDPANCMNCTMKHSLDVIPKLRKVLLAAPEEENKSE